MPDFLADLKIKGPGPWVEYKGKKTPPRSERWRKVEAYMCPEKAPALAKKGGAK
jgi:hypothetical protein